MKEYKTIVSNTLRRFYKQKNIPKEQKKIIKYDKKLKYFLMDVMIELEIWTLSKDDSEGSIIKILSKRLFLS